MGEREIVINRALWDLQRAIEYARSLGVHILIDADNQIKDLELSHVTQTGRAYVHPIVERTL